MNPISEADAVYGAIIKRKMKIVISEKSFYQNQAVLEERCKGFVHTSPLGIGSYVLYPVPDRSTVNWTNIVRNFGR